MAILIDPPAWPAHGRRWSHLVSDTSLEELHAFARSLGIPERGFEGDHYDIPEERYAAVLAAGARPTPPRDLLRALQASGLRLSKRAGDKGVARQRGVLLASGTVADIDLLVSSRPVDERRVFAAMVFLRDAGGDFAVVHSVRRQQWGSPGGWRELGETVRENAAQVLVLLRGDPTPLRGVAGLRGQGRAGLRDRRREGLEHVLPRRPQQRPGQVPEALVAEGHQVRRRQLDPDLLDDLANGEFWWPLAARLRA